MTVDTLNYILALLGVIVLLSTVFLIIDLKTNRSLKPVVEKYGLLLAFLVTFGGSAMTLFYSEVLGFIPCGLCWMQRVFLYPQVFLLGTALWLKEQTIKIYALVLCVPGIIIGLYQHYMQMGGADLGVCPTAGVGADCSERIMFEFGFMTFPLLSVIMFGFLVAIYYYLIKIEKITN
jgi:disulfide bond formation protein DsbB